MKWRDGHAHNPPYIHTYKRRRRCIEPPSFNDTTSIPESPAHLQQGPGCVVSAATEVDPFEAYFRPAAV